MHSDTIEHQPSYLDFDALFSTLIDFSEKKCARLKVYYDFDNELMLRRYLREFRTVGIDAPRQCGKTNWVMKQLTTDPTACVVVCNSNMVEHYLLTAGPSVRGRVFTAKDVAYAMRAGEAPRWKKIYLDEATYVMDRLASNTFYKWVALAGDPDVQILMIS